MDIKFYENIVRGYFPKTQELKGISNDKNLLSKFNVKYHSCDLKWLERYILNCFYSELSESFYNFEIHDFLRTSSFNTIVKDFQNSLIDLQTERQLNLLNKNLVVKIGTEKAYSIVHDSICGILISEYNMKKSVITKRLEERKEEINNRLNNILLNSEKQL